jgi:hypothetical protein
MAKRARKRRKYIRLTRHCGAELESSAWASATRIDEPHRPWRFEITGFQVFDPKAGGLHQIVRFAIEVAAARNTLPYWREPVLPTSHANFRCTPVLGEEKHATGFEDPANFRECFGGVVDGAKREGHYHRVYAFVVQRQGFSGAAQEFDSWPSSGWSA